jgi:hypothetical protein
MKIITIGNVPLVVYIRDNIEYMFAHLIKFCDFFVYSHGIKQYV